jgi:hypothetical protein
MWGMTKVGARVIIAQDDVAFTDISSRRLFTALPQVVGEVPPPVPAKVRFATNETASEVMTDTPLKGSIDATGAEAARPETAAAPAKPAPEAEAANGAEGVSADSLIELSQQAETPRSAISAEDARIDSAIDAMVSAGAAEADAAIVTGTATIAEPKSEPLTEKEIVLSGAKDPMLRAGPISVYVSRKLGRLFVRKGFAEVFEAPVTIAQPDEPLGTHVFTALEGKNDGTMRWNVASLPTERVVKKGKYQMTTTARGEKLRKQLAAPTHEVVPPGDPNAALDRITIPEEALARITELMTPGATLIISDLGMSYETGRGTDFIVLTR